jgi:mRNA-degrading endonuclease RelE of RelBE toxin-antitoxin system
LPIISAPRGGEQTPLRIKIKNYVLYFNVDEKKNTINALRFLYNKRDWLNILKEKSIEEIME